MRTVRFNSLTGLRALAMLTIFGCHLSYLSEAHFQRFYSLINNGRFGVNFFLVLSGFVLAFGYSDKLNANSITQDVQFVKRRISKIYIPYLITMILAIPLYIFTVRLEEGSLSIKLLITRIIINISMIQSVIPFAKYSYTINGVSWFISTIFIIYLFTPAILRLNQKAANSFTLLKLLFMVIAVLAVNCCLNMLVRQIEYVSYADRGLNIIYINPLIRLFPFLLGIAAYNIYCRLSDFRINKGSIAEILGIALFFLWWIIADEIGFPTVLTECMDMLVALFVILVFVFSDKGIVSDMLSNEKIQLMGNISLDFYLLHYLVIEYGMMAAKHFRLDKGFAVLPLTILFFVISLGGAYLIHFAADWLLAAFKKKNQTLKY